jgi:glycosyltransferase involved in cell wall biosynthesis
MKICLVSSYFAPLEIGGAERVARRLAENLVARGWEVVVLTTGPRDETLILPSGIKVCRIRPGDLFFKDGSIPVPGWRRWPWRLQNVWNASMYRKVRRIFELERPRLVNVHNYASFSPAVFAAARALRLPVVFTAHDYFPLCRHYSFEKNGRPCRGHCLACRLWCCWNRRYLEMSSAVYLSGYSRSIYRRCLKPLAEAVLPNPVDLSDEQITRIRAEKESLRLSQPPAPLTWLFLGRLDPLKGIRNVMRCWERLDVAAVRLWIAGDGPLAGEVLAWAERRPGVEYLGMVAGRKKHEMLVAADGLLLPSRPTDVSPLVIPEALGFGIPVLGANAGAVAELIRTGVTGWLCDCEDAIAFSRRVAEISRDPGLIRSLSAGCFAAAREQTYERYMPQIMEYYAGIAGGRMHGLSGKKISVFY